ncbi:MAG: HAD-IC family P-type ATPase, partial [Clostridiales bacterium]
SEHPLADAITTYLAAQVQPYPIDNFESITGKGIQTAINEDLYWTGSRRLLETHKCPITPEQDLRIHDWQEKGKSVVFFGKDRKLIAIIAIADTLKKTTKEAISQLKKMNIEVHMLTGDAYRTAAAMASGLEIEHFRAEVLPDDKEQYIIQLQQQG